MEKVFTHAFIKNNQLTLVFMTGDVATYRLAKKQPDQYVCSYGMMAVIDGTVFLYNMERNYSFKIRG